MNPLLNKFKNKRLAYFAGVACLVLILSATIPALRAPLLESLKIPLTFFSLIKREIRGVIFYHRNFMQNEKLQKEINLLKEKLNNLEEISQENVRLRTLLSFKQDSPYKVIVARVIGRSPESWSSVVIIGKGKSQGIKEGMAVRDYRGLVGRVSEVSESTSKITLINDPNFGVSAIVQRSRQEGLVGGALGGLLVMRYLPNEADIEISDVIVTSGLTALYPKGLLIGTVVDIGSDFSGLSRYATVKPAAELSRIEEVLVIVP